MTVQEHVAILIFSLMTGFSASAAQSPLQPTDLDSLTRALNLRCTAPGVWMNESGTDTEKAFARSFGDRILRSWQLHFLLIPSVGDRETPSFDGIVADAQGRILANCSLKQFTYLHKTSQKRLRGVISSCEKKSFAEGWERPRPLAVQHFYESEVRSRKRRRLMRSYLLEDQRWKDLINLFVTTPARPLWILFQCERPEAYRANIDAMVMRHTELRPHLTSFFFTNDRAGVAMGGRVYGLNEIDCSDRLLGSWRESDVQSVKATIRPMTEIH